MKRIIALLCLLSPSVACAAITVCGPVSPDGKEVVCDLPVDQRIKNIGSKLDGAGMCVFSSIEMALRYQGVEHMRGFRDWCAEHYPGGGYPSKVDQLLKAFCKAKAVPLPDYIQYEGKDPTVLDACLKTGRMACVTYCGRDPHYGPSKSVAHMTCSVYCDSSAGCILDNNFIGRDELLWMNRKEILDRWTGNGGGWVVIFLAPPPPPVPHN